ncbi:MAG: glycosyltransferase family 2 protein [Actinobacteria bacterium]|nr:glycosyltransferase family 2 protein [Actinomycetota bacterium]
MPPLVSICITNHNYARFLPEAIDSALSQTWRDVEVIVVDDGSTDTSRQVMDGYADSIVAVYKENGGQGSAFNTGFAACSGELVVFLDADDVLEPGMAAAAADELAVCPDLSKVQFMMRLVDGDGVDLGVTIPPRPGDQRSGDFRRHVLRFRTYPWPPNSANVYAARALRRVLPLPSEHYWTYCDAYLAELMPLLGPVRSVGFVAANYRLHGANDFLSTEVGTEWLWRKIALIELGHEHVRRLASDLGIDGVPEAATDLRDAAFLGYRLASLRLDPAHHPLAGDRHLALVASGVKASLGNPLFCWPSRLRRSAWFVAAGLAPGRHGREIARRWLPDGPGPRRGWPRKASAPRAPFS